MSYMLVARNNSLNCQIFELSPAFLRSYYLWVLQSHHVNLVENCSQTSFVANIIVRFIIILNEVVTFLVDGIVRKMHTQVVEIAANRWGVFLRGESCKSLLVDEDAQGNYRRYQNINTQVKLQVVYQEGLVQIPLCDVMLPRYKPVERSSQKYSFPLATSLWFYDKSLCFPVIELFLERF